MIIWWQSLNTFNDNLMSISMMFWQSLKRWQLTSPPPPPFFLLFYFLGMEFHIQLVLEANINCCFGNVCFDFVIKTYVEVTIPFNFNFHNLLFFDVIPNFFFCFSLESSTFLWDSFGEDSLLLVLFSLFFSLVFLLCWFPSMVLSSYACSLFVLLSSSPNSRHVTSSALLICRLIWSSPFSLAPVSMWVLDSVDLLLSGKPSLRHASPLPSQSSPPHVSSLLIATLPPRFGAWISLSSTCSTRLGQCAQIAMPLSMLLFAGLFVVFLYFILFFYYCYW